MGYEYWGKGAVCCFCGSRNIYRDGEAPMMEKIECRSCGRHNYTARTSYEKDSGRAPIDLRGDGAEVETQLS